ncbi:MAG: ABC transporter permease [Acidimicrobiia bacterium]|nr:ABC transporter permease [Acidimicrobiia bacterium]
MTLPSVADRRVQIAGAVVVAYSTLYWVPGSPLPDKVPWGVLAQGVIFGSSYALLAMGLILVYRTTRIVNFAYGAMGAMPGSITAALFTAKHWNYWLAIAVGVGIGIASGAAIEVLVVRRFERSSRLVLTVASIGLAQILGAIGLGVGVALGTDALIGDIRTPISGSFFVRPYPVRGDHLLMIGVVPVVLAGLAWYLLRTDAGVAVRAAAENQDRALLLGVPVRRLQTVVWAVAGGLSTITFISKAPFTGVVPEALVGATTILPGLAAAAVARFQSLPVALWAGLGLGVAEWTIRWNVSAESIFDVTFFVVILAALLLRKVRTSRAETGENTWDSAGVLKPVPEELRMLPEVRWPRIAFAVIGAALLLVIPLNAAPSTVSTMSFAVVWAIVATSLVVLTGWGGNVSLGQFAIVGVGAMATGNLMMRWNVDFVVAALFAVAVGAAVALVIGLPALRIRGLYLAVTTLAFAVALDSYFLNPVNFASFVPQSLVRPVLWKRFALESQWATFYLCLGCLVLVVGLVRGIRRSRPGRVIIGTRDNDRAADAFGVPTTRIKIQTFALAGCIAGLAGALYMLVTAQTGIGPGTFRPTMSIEVFSYAVIGGLGSVAGSISGIVLFRGLDFVLAKQVSGPAGDALRLSLSGGGLLVILYFLPGGLWQLVQRVRDRYLRLVAHRRGVLVPSLVEDRRVDDPAAPEEVDDRPADETAVIGGALR